MRNYVFNQETTATVSLRSLPALLESESILVRKKQEKLDSYLREFEKNNFQHSTEFTTLVDTMLEHIERNVKVYAQKSEQEKIERLGKMVKDFFQEHLFTLEHEELKKIISQPI